MDYRDHHAERPADRRRPPAWRCGCGRQSLISVGAIALATGLVIRIVNMSGWIMWVVNGIFENIGTVQDGIRRIAQPRSVHRPRAGADSWRSAVAKCDSRTSISTTARRGGVISGLNLDIKPGEKIGLVGPSGAGKSTLVNVLLRLYDLQGGRILIDGQDIAAGRPRKACARTIGMVTQDTSLLHRSIRDNLLYGRPDATEAELWRSGAQGPRRRVHPAAVGLLKAAPG